MRRTLLRTGILVWLAIAGWNSTFAAGEIFEANCVNLLSEEGNTRLYIQFGVGLLKDAVAELRINMVVKAAETPNILVNRYDQVSFNFLESGGRKDFRRLYNFDLDPGSYRMIVEIEDLLTGKLYYKEIPYNCSDKAEAYNVSDVLFLEDTAMVLRNPSVLIQDEVSGASEFLNFYAEIYTNFKDPLAAPSRIVPAGRVPRAVANPEICPGWTDQSDPESWRPNHCFL